MRGFIVTVLLIACFASSTEAQRIRYKNLFPILQSKDYKTAEPQLLKFLEENDDEANAYFYLGEIIISKLDTIEIFPSTQKFDSMANRAIEAYKKSISLVDDREVRKNDEYYAAYNRRDLRTGKFGIKKSDIHLDYENKIKEVNERKELIDELHELKKQSIQAYEKFTKIVEEFYGKYPDELAFVLRANSDDIEASKSVITDFEEFIDTYQKFINKLKSLNHPAYNPQIKIIGIVNWQGLKPLKTDFSDFSITIQDYAEYLNKQIDKVDSDVKPLKELLYKTNENFNEAIAKNRKVKDSSNIQEMSIPKELKKSLDKFDKSDVILNLLNYKKQKSQTGLLTNAELYPVLSDSSNVYQRANLVQEHQEMLSAQLELIEAVEENISERIIKDFQLFLEGFKPSIKAYLDTEKTIIEQKLDSVTQKSDIMARQIQYFSHNSDSIYLTPLIAANKKSSKYVMNTIELDSMLVVGGLYDQRPFAASAGFDMKIKSFEFLQDSAYAITNIMLINGNVLINLGSKSEEQKTQFLKYFSPKLEEIWSLEYESETTMGDAKVEAGIFFIYDQEGNVLKTLNSKGEVIGN